MAVEGREPYNYVFTYICSYVSTTVPIILQKKSNSVGAKQAGAEPGQAQPKLGLSYIGPARTYQYL